VAAMEFMYEPFHRRCSHISSRHAKFYLVSFHQAIKFTLAKRISIGLFLQIIFCRNQEARAITWYYLCILNIDDFHHVFYIILPATFSAAFCAQTRYNTSNHSLIILLICIDKLTILKLIHVPTILHSYYIKLLTC